MPDDTSDTESKKRIYGWVAIAIAAAFVLSSILAIPVLMKGFGPGDGGLDGGAEQTMSTAGTEDPVEGEEPAEETPGLYPKDETTYTVPDPAKQWTLDDGPLVEDEVTGEMLINPEPNLYVTPKEYDSNGMRRVTPGTLDWKYDTPEGEELSTPGLVDLNGDGTHEVVFASHGDAIYALSSSGQKRWVNTENEIEQADDGHFGNLDFEPPPIFSSITPADIDGSSDPEILVGVKDGIVCLNSDGSVHWKKGLTSGYYFSTPVVTDIEGEYTGDKDDLEVILGSDGTDRNAWMEAFHVDGGSIFREQVTSGGEPALLAASPVAQDLDGSFYDPEDDPPEPDEEVWHELEIGSHDHGMRIFAYSGQQGGSGEPDFNEVTGSNLAGHQTYATSAVGNFTMNNNNAPEEYEIIVGSCEGYQTTWESWGGTIYSYDGYGNELWQISTGGSRAAVMSSVAVADIQMAELDEEEEEIQYEIFVGCDSGKLWALDADYRQELWSYTSAGRMMSSPAICNVDSDDELEVLVGSNDGYIYCFDGDPSDPPGGPVDEGITDSGGSSGAYDILWKYNTGGQGVGVSSCVAGDIDNDNVLEVVIGDISGTIYCIEAGSSSRGQIDWPMFHYDLNKTGFYNPNIQFGVDLSPTVMGDGPDSMIKSVQPGESVYYNVTIKNTGSGVGTAAIDTFFLSIEGEDNNPGWSAEFSEGLLTNTLGEYYITLEVDQTQDFVMKVTAPFEGSIGEVAQFNVSANSTNDPFIRDIMITSTQLEINLDLEVEFTKPLPVVNDPTNPYNGEKWAKVDPGGEYVATLELKNKGNLNDSYELRILGITSGWDVAFVASQTTTYTTNLTAPIFEGEQSSEVISIRVNVPFDAQAQQSATIVVKAVSVKSKFLLTPGDDTDWIEAQDYCIIEAGATNELQLDVVDPLQYVDPGGSTTFIMYVTNRGNRQMSVEFDHQGLEGREDDDDWEVKFRIDDDYKDETVVASGQKKELRVEVVAPSDARAELRLPLTISGVDVENPNIFKTVGITTIVRHMYKINATVIPEYKMANPGDLVVYRIEVVNEGNGEDVVTPSPHSVPMGWDIYFTAQGKGEMERQLEYPLGFAEMVNISMKVQVPVEALTAEYTSVINISGGGTDNTVYVNMVTAVNQTYDLVVLSAPETSEDEPSHFINETMDPGSTIIQRVMVANYANGPDDITFSVNCSTDGWDCVIGAVSNTGDYTPHNEDLDFTLPIPFTSKGDPVNYLPDKNSSKEDTVSLTLGVEETAWVQVVITAPKGARDTDEVEVFIRAESTSPYEDTSDNSVMVTIDIDLSDLKFTKDGMKYPSSMKEGKIYTINAKVINVGDIEARDLWVTFYVDDKEVDRVFISRLIPTRTQIVAFTWSAEGGDHKFQMFVDSEETVIESDEDNNWATGAQGGQQTANINVEEDKGGDAESLVPRAMSVVVILLLILLLIALAYITKKYRDLTKKQQ